MATDGPTPNPCNREVFEKGKAVVILNASSNAAEAWVQSVAKEAQANVDWHYSGGRAQVLHLGDDESRARVYAAINKLKPALKGRILRIVTPNERGLYRNGITPIPKGTIAIDPDTQEPIIGK